MNETPSPVKDAGDNKVQKEIAPQRQRMSSDDIDRRMEKAIAAEAKRTGLPTTEVFMGLL